MSMKGPFTVLAFVMVSVVAGAHAQAPPGVVDQYNLTGDINWAIHNASDIGQVFAAGMPGTLVGLELSLSRCANPDSPLVLDILTTSGGVPQPSPVLASVIIPNSAIPATTPQTSLELNTVTGTYVDLAGAGITLQSGVQYAFRLSTDEGVCYAIRGDTAGNYPGGQRFTQWTLQPSDLVFKTFVVSSPPVPASSPFGLALLLLGIAGAAFFILRR